MRLRWLLSVAFVGLSLVQLAAVMPLALRNLDGLLERQHQARVAQSMVAVDAEAKRLEHDVRRTMDELAQSPAMEEVARDAAQLPPPAHVTRAAATLMAPRGLDVLAVIDERGRTLSSGHLPARLGEPDDPLFSVTTSPQKVHVTTVELLTERGLISAPAVVSARSIDYGERRVWAVGGVLLSEARAAALSALTGARVQVFSKGELVAGAGVAEAPVTVRQLELGPAATLSLAFSAADLAATRREVLRAFLGLALVGLLLSIGLGLWLSGRLTRPLEALTDAARGIGAGEPGRRVDAASATREVTELIGAFNRMTGELKDATDRLVASERLAAWQEVARRLAHEIKNPLTPIRMSLETLLAASQRGPLDDRFRGLFSESARAVLEEVDRLKRIVDEFSQFARLPKPTLNRLDLSELLRSILALYADHDGLTFGRELPDVALVNGDRDQLTQVVVNLLKNAEEAMAGRQGRIDVVLTVGAAVVLEIRDEGPGLPPHLLTRIFEPYVTTKPQGTGLGLSIALRIAQEHQGSLELLPRSTGGLCARLTLPGAEER